MIQPDNAQTRKDEVRFRTSDIRRMVGKYLASNAIVDKAFCLAYKEQKV